MARLRSVSTLPYLAARDIALGPRDISHLKHLVADWQLLADLSFADLLLWVLRTDGTWVCVAQVRPLTSPTAYEHDRIGQRAEPTLAGLLASGAAARHPLRITGLPGRPGGRGGPGPARVGSVPVSRDLIPVRFEGRVVGVLLRDRGAVGRERSGGLEANYRRAADLLCEMVAEGSFPATSDGSDDPLGPRVGDGLVRLDPAGVVTFASPNAQSALRRLGLARYLVGERLAEVVTELMPEPGERRAALSGMAAALAGESSAPVELVGSGAAAVLRVIPVRRAGRGAGALVLLRDVTDLRRRESQLRGKEATIREVHHRVKNSLQSVSALLRLQARRVGSPEAADALLEAVRRVSSIALVHEALARAGDEAVPFDDVVRVVVASMSELGGVAGDIRTEGVFGEVPSEVATPLVVVIGELLHNAAEHAYPDGHPGPVIVRAGRRRGQLRVVVSDRGVGLPRDGAARSTPGLGLSIVRTLVEDEIGGLFSIGPGVGTDGTACGTEAVVEVPLRNQSVSVDQGLAAGAQDPQR